MNNLFAQDPRFKRDDEFLTKKELAALLKIGLRTVNSIMARGDIPFKKLSGYLVRFHVDDVERYLNGLPPRRANNDRKGAR
jgi:excisionase family DNA binding protein